MAIEYNFKYMPLVGKLSGESMVQQTETAINEIAKIVNDNTAQAEIINTLAEQANANSVEALEKATEALDTSSRVYIKETLAVNLNNYCESQLIYINNVYSQNMPVAHKGFLEVKTNDDKTQATQVFIDDTNKEVYTRSGAITETTVGDVTTYTASYSAWNKAASTNYVENMVLIRQNSTAYSVGDIARSTSLASYMLLECISAGTTGASEPSFSGADVGDVITDGSVSWTIIKYASTEYVKGEVAKCLPLSGGTLTGDVFGVTPPNGDNSTKIATTEFVNAKAGNYLPLSGGTMTGSIALKNTTVVANRDVTDSWTVLLGGTTDTDGAYIRLDGKTSNQAGCFLLKAADGTNSSLLVGHPNGTLTWNGYVIDRINASGLGYVRYENGLQLCYQTVVIPANTTNGIKVFSCPVPFVSIVNIQATPYGVNGAKLITLISALILSGSQFQIQVATATNTVPTYDTYLYVFSIGYWK